MARRPRTVIPGVPHHVTQRGNNRQTVFCSDYDRQDYLGLLRQRAERDGLRILGYCLMSNHTHLVAVPLRPDSLARVLGQTHSQYAIARNKFGGRTGHLWQNRFYSCPLDRPHLIRALRYVELNPVRAGLVRAAWEWRWSSALAHVDDSVLDPLLDPGPEWLGAWDYRDWRASLALGSNDSDRETIRRATLAGEPLGSSEFVRDLERRAGRRLIVLPRGRPKKMRLTPFCVG